MADNKYNSNEGMGLSLLKKGQKGFFHFIFSRLGLILILLALQVFLLFGVFFWFREIIPYFWGGTTLFTVGMVLYLLNSPMDPSAKITWLVVIMLLPVFGVLFFWYTKSDLGYRAERFRMRQLLASTREQLSQNASDMDALRKENPGAAALAHYLASTGCHPVFRGTSAVYFPSGEAKWEEMLVQLQQAKHFIFLEYFIIDEGLMWGKILEILAQKAAEGVDVRVMYDGTCEFSTLPHGYPGKLRKLGIQCKIFGRVLPFVSTSYNYRDHRKILVIDGHTAFTGGVNLADEYINHIEKFGRWKDAAVMLKGEAAKSFTLMFLQMWGLDERTTDFGHFLSYPAYPPQDASGFAIPYGDSPLDGYKVGERVYMDMLNRAERYVYIMSPYLILDREMETALKFAAERGVDVRLILPGVPDKSLPYALAKTHYASLLESGIQIYEYTPGFVHAKVFVSDGREAVVGTINLDYRSLYHHFECAVYLYGAACIPAILADYEATLQQCRAVTDETIRHEKLRLKLMGYVFKPFSPLM